jgi:hypothetical protein
VQKYVLQPESRRASQRALATLLALSPVPVPENYQTREREYEARKTNRDKEGK